MKLSRRDLVWIVPSGIAASFFGWFGWRAVKIQFLKTKAETEPSWKRGERVKVGAVADFDEEWSFRYFDYQLPRGKLPSVVLRLPQPVPGGITVDGRHFAGWSRICTHQGCTVDYVRNLEAGAILYNYRSDHPFLGCRCHFGAFDPLEAGKAVFGPPRYPLPRLLLEEEDGVIYAAGYETPLRPIESYNPIKTVGGKVS